MTTVPEPGPELREADDVTATMTTAPLEAQTLPLSRDELVLRAAGLRDLLWQEAPDSDQQRRLTDRSIEAVNKAGLLRLMTPRLYGGHQADVRTVLDVTTELGRGCGNAAWVTGVLNSGNFMAGLYGDEAREEIWGEDPEARLACVLVPPSADVHPVDGGLRVSGRWGYASGSAHAEWFALLLPVPGEGQRPDMSMVLVPAGEIQIEDTWHVVGMRGTGSNHVVVQDTFVPAHRILPWAPALAGEHPNEHRDEILYRSPVGALLQVFLLGSMVGAAQAGLDYCLEKAPKRAIAASTYRAQTDSVPFLLDVAEAQSLIDTARFHSGRAADTVDKYAAQDQQPDIATRARMRMDAARTVQSAREAVDLLMTAHGTSAFAEANPLQRIWRDVNLGSRHGGFGSHVPQEVFGRSLVGQDPRQTSYLL